MAFTYVQPDVVIPQIKTAVTGWRLELLNSTLEGLSARLSAWYPSLRQAYKDADDESPLRDLVDTMIIDAARKLVNNPEGMSSETMGPFAYSRFDSEDTAKFLFNARDLKALEALLSVEGQRQRGSFTMNRKMYPAAPMPRPGKYTNSRRWKAY